MESTYQIVPAERKYARSYCRAVGRVAGERKYLASTEGFSLEQTESFLNMIVENRFPSFSQSGTAR